jgi:predicted Zn finger-like uncharacterized protein
MVRFLDRLPWPSERLGERIREAAVTLAATWLVSAGAWGRVNRLRETTDPMDVQCDRCRTEYTLNDAVVSARGTPVRCTTCGHEFKVYRAPDLRSRAAAVEGEVWVVTTSNGQEFRFATFRELQNAILSKRVLREDLLSRNGAPGQNLASIAELEPLFDRASSSRLEAMSPSERARAAASPPTPGHSFAPEEAPPSPRSAGASVAGASSIPPRAKIDTLRPPATGAAAPPPAPSSSPSSASRQRETPTPPSYTGATGGPVKTTLIGVKAVEPSGATAPPTSAPAMAPAPPHELHAARVSAAQDALPAPPRPLWRGQMPSDGDLLPDNRSLSPASDEIYSAVPRRRVGGWIVALALLMAVGVVGWAAAKPYLVAHDAGAPVQLSPRAQAFLVDGERALANGDLDAAQENVDKASVLAEDDARVLLDEARVAAAKADVPWLKLRLLPPDAADEQRTARAALDEMATRAKRLSAKARDRAPDDAAAVRVEVDALRLAGDREGARARVPKIMVQASQPETAYVLAALDLAEPEPVWATVVERLRLAASGEGNAGRAEAALVYALARSGDTAAAGSELAKIKTLARPYPLLPNLSAFLEKTSVKAVASAGPAPLPSPVASASARRAGASSGSGAGGGEAPVGDINAAMQLASNAIKKGDFARAGQIYETLATRNPNDSEALSGLGDVARLTGNMAGAISAYRRAIAVNPSYLPALLGLADTQWSSGDRAGATHGYSDIVDRFPEGTYPAYVAKRVAAADSQGAGTANAAPGNAAPPTPVTPANDTKPAAAADEHAE